MAQRLISIVAPVFNEESNVRLLVEELQGTWQQLPYGLEIVLVNDGSTAETTRILDELCEQHPEIGVIHLSRNFGHQAALSAGLEAARGDAVISLDADLQHPVSVIPALIREWEAGHEVVHAVREDPTRTFGLFKRATSSGYYRMINLLSETRIPNNAADFRLLDRAALDALLSLPERARFLRGLAVWIGFNQTSVPYAVAPRRSGISKFTLARMLTLATDGVTAFSTLPLKLALVIGTLISTLALAYLGWVVIAYFLTDRAIKGWSSLMVAVLFIGGLQLNLMGVLGLYIGKIYDETKGRPIFIVKRRAGALARGTELVAARTGAQAAPHDDGRRGAPEVLSDPLLDKAGEG